MDNEDHVAKLREVQTLLRELDGLGIDYLLVLRTPEDYTVMSYCDGKTRAEMLGALSDWDHYVTHEQDAIETFGHIGHA